MRLLLKYARRMIRYALTALARMGTKNEIATKVMRRFQLRNAIPANNTPMRTDDVRYRIPLQASAIFQSPDGVDIKSPFCTAGTPDSRTALTANIAVNR